MPHVQRLWRCVHGCTDRRFRAGGQRRADPLPAPWRRLAGKVLEEHGMTCKDLGITALIAPPPGRSSSVQNVLEAGKPVGGHPRLSHSLAFSDVHFATDRNRGAATSRIPCRTFLGVSVDPGRFGALRAPLVAWHRPENLAGPLSHENAIMELGASALYTMGIERSHGCNAVETVTLPAWSGMILRAMRGKRA